MGRYIDDILQPGEKVLYSTNAHWIFFLPAMAGWAVAIVFLVLSRMVATDTPMLSTFLGAAEAEGRERFIATIPWGRLNRPEDIARAAVFLASSEADMVTGTAFEVDGGRDVARRSKPAARKRRGRRTFVRIRSKPNKRSSSIVLEAFAVSSCRSRPASERP